jgi:hypothetical protein
VAHPPPTPSAVRRDNLNNIQENNDIEGIYIKLAMRLIIIGFDRQLVRGESKNHTPSISERYDVIDNFEIQLLLLLLY